MHNNHPIFESEDINDIYMSVPFNHLYRGVVDRDVPRINLKISFSPTVLLIQLIVPWILRDRRK